MKTDIVINYGVGSVQLNTGKNVTHKVTRIHADLMNDMIKIIYEHGLYVDRNDMSMENAQEIGLINLNALKPFLKK